MLARAKEAPTWARDELRSVVSRCGSRERRRQPGLWGSERVDSAIALGAIQPQIVLPLRSLVPANRSAVRAALAHEWAHIRHGDLWLLALERLPQRYTRLAERTYRYEAPSEGFVAELSASAAGFVLRYPGLWDADE